MRLRGRTIGDSIVRCRSCGELATHTVRETRYVRGWGQLLDRRFDPAISRTASCATCGLTYPVRATDRTADALAHREQTGATEARSWA